MKDALARLSEQMSLWSQKSGCTVVFLMMGPGYASLESMAIHEAAMIRVAPALSPEIPGFSQSLLTEHLLDTSFTLGQSAD